MASSAFLGGSILHQATVTLTDTQIKTISGGANSNRVQIVPAPGLGLMFLLASWGAVSNFTSAYTNIDAADAGLLIDTGQSLSNGIFNSAGGQTQFTSLFSNAGVRAVRGGAATWP